MANKKIYSRMQQKHDVETNWGQAVNFIPLAGEIIVYDADENNPKQRIVIGDGVTKLSELVDLVGFIGGGSLEDIINGGTW